MVFFSYNYGNPQLHFPTCWGSASLLSEYRAPLMSTHHGARQGILIENFNDLWNSSHPYYLLSHHNYFWWGYVKRKLVGTTSPCILEELKAFDLAAVSTVNDDTLTKDLGGIRPQYCHVHCVTQKVLIEHFRNNCGCFFTNWTTFQFSTYVTTFSWYYFIISVDTKIIHFLDVQTFLNLPVKSESWILREKVFLMWFRAGFCFF